MKRVSRASIHEAPSLTDFRPSCPSFRREQDITAEVVTRGSASGNQQDGHVNSAHAAAPTNAGSFGSAPATIAIYNSRSPVSGHLVVPPREHHGEIPLPSIFNSRPREAVNIQSVIRVGT